MQTLNILNFLTIILCFCLFQKRWYLDLQLNYFPHLGNHQRSIRTSPKNFRLLLTQHNKTDHATYSTGVIDFSRFKICNESGSKCRWLKTTVPCSKFKLHFVVLTKPLLISFRLTLYWKSLGSGTIYFKCISWGWLMQVTKYVMHSIDKTNIQEKECKYLDRL